MTKSAPLGPQATPNAHFNEKQSTTQDLDSSGKKPTIISNEVEIPVLLDDSDHESSLETTVPVLMDISSIKQKYQDPAFYPDRGSQAWLQVLGAFLVAFSTWGITTSFGVFTAYYKEVLLPDVSSFKIGWINSVQTALIFYGATLTGKLFDSGYFYVLEFTGIAVTIVCFTLIGECTQYYQLLLAQGVGLGLGMGILFGPVLACMGTYFKKNRTLAMAIAPCGAGVGGTVIPIITNNLLYNIGFKWTIRALALVELVLFFIIAALMRDRIPRNVRQAHLLKKTGSSSFWAFNTWVDTEALRDPVFMLFLVGISMCFFVIYPPFAYLQSYATHLGASALLTKYIVAILAACSVVGRLSMFLWAKIFGPLNSTGIFSFFCGVTIYTWAAVNSEAGLICFTLFCGYFTGVINAFPPCVIPLLTTDVTRLGVRFGMVFFGVGTAVLFSIPVTGGVLGTTFDQYSHVAILCGSFLMAGSALLVGCRVACAGFKWIKI